MSKKFYYVENKSKRSNERYIPWEYGFITYKVKKEKEVVSQSRNVPQKKSEGTPKVSENKRKVFQPITINVKDIMK